MSKKRVTFSFNCTTAINILRFRCYGHTVGLAYQSVNLCVMTAAAAVVVHPRRLSVCRPMGQAV